MHTKFWPGNLKGRNRLGYLDEDNIKMYLREIGWEFVDCIHLAQYGNIVMYLLVS